MLKLPPIKRTTGRRKRPILNHIESSIFRNGLTWFDIDSVLDPYSLTWHKNTPLYEQVEKYFSSKKELADESIALPVRSEFDEGKLLGYIGKDLFQTKDDVIDRLSDIDCRIESLKKQWEVLEQKELEFKASVEACNKFIESNRNKRDASLRKIAYFKSRVQILTKRITTMERSNNILQKVIVKMTKHYKKHRMYYVFCAEAASMDKTNPLGLIDRYLGIKEVEEFVRIKLSTMIKKYTAMYTGLKQLETERKETIHSLIMQWNEIKMRYEEVSRRVLKSQNIYNKVREKCQSHIWGIVSTIQGIAVLYRRIRARDVNANLIPHMKIYECLLYISSKIEKLKTIRIFNRHFENEEKLRKRIVESSSSDFVVRLKTDLSPISQISPEDPKRELPQSKENTLLRKDTLTPKGDDSDVKATPMHIKDDNKRIENRTLYKGEAVLPRIVPENDFGESKKTTFSASVVSFRSTESKTSRSSTKLPEIRKNVKHFTLDENKCSQHKLHSKDGELSSYEKRKIFDKERKLREDKKKKVMKCVRPMQRSQELNESLKNVISRYKSMDSELGTEINFSFSIDIKNFDFPHNDCFQHNQADCIESRRNTEAV